MLMGANQLLPVTMVCMLVGACGGGLFILGVTMVCVLMGAIQHLLVAMVCMFVQTGRKCRDGQCFCQQAECEEAG